MGAPLPLLVQSRHEDTMQTCSDGGLSRGRREQVGGSADPPHNRQVAMLFGPSRCDQMLGPEVRAPTPGFTVAHFGVFEEAMRWLNTSDVLTNGR